MRAPFYRCQSCGYDFTVTAGTLFADTHKPLRVWFEAVWYITNQKSGVSALGLQRVLGLGSYRTAWTWLCPAPIRIRGQRQLESVLVMAQERQGG